MAIIEHCHKVGLTGAESFLPSTDPETVKSIRRKVEAYNMLVVLNTRLPKEEGDVSSFHAAVAACKEAGAQRAASAGRQTFAGRAIEGRRSI